MHLLFCGSVLISKGEGFGEESQHGLEEHNYGATPLGLKKQVFHPYKSIGLKFTQKEALRSPSKVDWRSGDGEEAVGQRIVQ